MAYFAQHAAEALDPSMTALEALEERATNEWRPRLRGLLGNFLMSGDDVFKLCRILSGGERQRVAIARLLLESTNLILLDEPTHHLDLAGKDVLEEALEQYPGGVVVVTHDRSLMARVATRVIEVNDGRVIVYPGGYDDYESARIGRLKEEAGSGSAKPVSAPPSSTGGTVAVAPRVDRDAARDAEKRARAAQKKKATAQARVEAGITEAETMLTAVESELANPANYADGAKARELVTRQRTLRERLDGLWKELARVEDGTSSG
jgi:ATP-binding cassette subfamily F protein 3